MDEIRSPVTGGSTSLVDRFCAHSLIALYRDMLSVDVAPVFAGLDHIDLRRCDATGYEFFHPLTVAGGPEFYHALYSQEAHKRWAYKENRWEFDAVCALDGPFEAVLDVGAGDGRLLARLAGKADRAIGLETNPYGLANAREKGLTLHSEDVEGHAARNPQSYDLVTAMQVLEHVGAVREFVAACVAALKPGGRLVIAVPDNDGFVGLQRDLPLNLPPHHVGRWRRESLRALARHFDLELLAIDHEPLGEDILGWYRSVMEDRYLPQGRMVRGLYRRLGGAKVFQRFLSEQRHTIHGHTVMATYRRPQAAA